MKIENGGDNMRVLKQVLAQAKEVIENAKMNSFKE